LVTCVEAPKSAKKLREELERIREEVASLTQIDPRGPKEETCKRILELVQRIKREGSLSDEVINETVRAWWNPKEGN
jgi:sRNA-binding carbon storage regulator CsrA